VVASLLLALTGGALTIAGSLVALRFQARYARETRQEQYVREDAYRLFEKRVDAYSALYLRIGPARRALASLAKSAEPDELVAQARDARSDYWAAYTTVRLIGSQEVFEAADQMLVFIDDSIEQVTFDRARYMEILRRFTNTVRMELIGDGE
jgi:hypothetical protein